MRLNGIVAGLLSLVVPGLGQVYVGREARGAAVFVAVLVVGNLDVLWLSLQATVGEAAESFFGGILPRRLHDLFAAYGVIFWLWQVTDAYRLAAAADIAPGTAPTPGRRSGR